MALLKIYTQAKNKGSLNNRMVSTVKFISSAALNCVEIPTSPNNIEVVYCEGIDLAGIDYIIEIVACERPKMNEISENIIAGLNAVHPDKLFSIYFNLIKEEGMDNTPRTASDDQPISMEEAIKISRG